MTRSYPLAGFHARAKTCNYLKSSPRTLFILGHRRPVRFVFATNDIGPDNFDRRQALGRFWLCTFRFDGLRRLADSFV